VASQYRATNGPPTRFGSNCRLTPFVYWAPLSHAGSALFNAVILVMAMSKFIDQRAQQSRIGYLAYRNSILYIAIATATSVAVLVVQSLNADHQMIKQAALPYSTLITATMGARVFLNLRLSNPTQNTQDYHLTVTPPTDARQGTVHDSDKVGYITPVPGETDIPNLLGAKPAQHSYTSFPSPRYPTSTFALPAKIPQVKLPQSLHRIFPSPPPHGSTSDVSFSSPSTPPTESLPSMVFATPSGSPGKYGSPASFKSKLSLPITGKGKKEIQALESGWL
jgi:hypothetical protein